MRKRLLIAVGLFALFFAAFATLGHTAPPEAPKSAVVNPVGASLGSGELRKKILLDVIRHRAVVRAARDGIAGPDGKVRKLTRAEAKELVDGVRDETILAGAVEQGAPVGGGKLEALLNWLWEHKEELIKFILSIIALFGDDGP